MAKEINPNVKPGDRIICAYMKDEYSPVPVGTGGTVKRVGHDPYDKEEKIIYVEWDNGSSLSLISVEDIWMRESDISLKKPMKESIQEQDDYEVEYGKSIGKSSPFNATAQGTSAAMKEALSSYYDVGIIDTWPQPLGVSGVYKLPGSDKVKELKRIKPETQQRFIQWYDDVIINYDSTGTRGKIFEGLIAGIFGGNVEGNENRGNADKTDVKIIVGPSKGTNISVKFNKTFKPNGSQLIGGITKAVTKYIIGEHGKSIRHLIDKLSGVSKTGNGIKFKAPAVNQILKKLYLHFNQEGVKEIVRNIYEDDDSFQTIDWFIFATEGNLNEIIIFEYKKEDIIDHIMNNADNFSVNSKGQLYVKNLGNITPMKLLVQFPQYVKTQRKRTETTRKGSSVRNFTNNSVARTIKNKKTGDVIGRVRRIVNKDDINYFIEMVKGFRPLNKENKLDFINRTIIDDIKTLESDDIKIDSKDRVIEKLKELSNQKQREIYVEKAKLAKKGKKGGISRDEQIMNLFGDRGKNINPFIIQSIRKNPGEFAVNVLKLYGDRPEVKNYLSTLTEQTKGDLTDKLSNNDIDPSVLNDLLDLLTDEDITDLFLRNLDRKLLKSGDKNENIRKYISKYVDSLKSRGEIEQDPSDDYDVEDEFLYGGVEPEKSKIGRKQFKKELIPLQVELLKLQEHVKETGKPVVVVMEGRDSAGKGSTIRKMTEYLDPKYYNVVALGIATPEERKDWFGRYEKHIEPGKITFFDRSWYNRGIVEPVMGYGTEEEYFDFMENVNGFEQSLKDKGVELFKFWLSITPQTQQRRFELRKNSPLKYWKFSPNDEKSIDKWDDYTEYKEKVLKQTKEAQPWTVVDTNDKRAGTLNLLRHILQNVDYKDKDVKNLGTKFPEVVTTVNEQKSVPNIDTLVKMKDVFKYMKEKVFFDFLKKIRESGIVNMLESGQFLMSGPEYLKKFIEMEEMRGREFDEDMVEELLDLAEQTKNEIIQATFKIMEDKDIEDYSTQKINQIARKLSKDALIYYITMFSHSS